MTTTLRLTFLLGLDVRNIELKNAPRTIRKNKRKKSAIKSYKSKKSNKSRNSNKYRFKNPKNKKKRVSETNEIEEEEKEELKYTAIEVQEPLEYIHIEYQLIPECFKYDVDIVCWGPVVKICTASNSKFYKTVIKEHMIWIPIFVEHCFSQFNVEEFRTFLQHTISFCMKFGKNNVGASAKSDKISQFYVYKDADEDFSEVFAEKPPKKDNEIVEKDMQKLLQELLAFPFRGEIVSSIHNTNVAHACRILKIISKKVLSEEINCKSLEDDEKSTGQASKSESKKKISESESRSRNTKGKTGNKAEKIAFNFHIPAHIFLTDPVMATYRVRKATTKFTDLFVLLSSENLMSHRQKQEIDPLIIKIRKISNLPYKLLKDKGFDKIYVRCDIPNFIKFDTQIKPVANNVVFEESSLVFTGQIPLIKKLEYLQTRRVLFQILAVKDTRMKENTEPDQKSKKKKDKTKKGKKKETKTEEPKARDDSLLVAVAHFDMSSLKKNYSPFKERLPCHNPRSVFINFEGKTAEQFLDQFTVNELHIKIYPNMQNSSPLKENFLIACDTTLKVEAYFLRPQYISFHMETVTYKRFLIIVFKEEAAKLILNSILMHNHEKLTKTGPLFFPNICTRRAIDSNFDLLHNDNMLTGFIIDDGNCFIYFVEGPSNGFILSLLHQVSSYSYSTAKVFHNSEYLFEERLYNIFAKFNGFMMITLKFPLWDIFRRQEVYILGNVPIPCFQAIQKLLLIFKSTTFKTILSYDILPTETELVSLSIEFGLQVKFKFKESSDDELYDKNKIIASSTDLFKIPH